MRRPHRVLAVAATCLLFTVVSACGDDESGGKGGDAGSGTASLHGLDVVPADATNVEITRRAEVAERLAVDAETGATEEELQAYTKAMSRTAPWGGTELDLYVRAMNDEAEFSALDVDWQVTWSLDQSPPVHGWKMHDDLDLDAVGDDLAASGYEESESNGLRTFTANLAAADPAGLVGGKYPAVAMREVTLVPEQNLIVAGPADEALPVISENAESLAEAASAAEVTVGLDKAEYVALELGEGVRCADARATPAILESAGLDALEHPEAVGFAILPGEGEEATPRNVFVFSDADTAKADATARENYLSDGASLVTREPLADLIDDAEITTDGSVETVDYTFADGPERAVRMVQLHDGVSACNPG